MYETLITISTSPIYYAALLFLAVFPVTVSSLAVNSAREFYLIRSLKETERLNPHKEELFKAREKWETVSILIPAHNEEQSLENTINKALQIDWPKIEIIVINDGSNDQTEQIINSFLKNGNVKTIKNETNLGKSAALNQGIAKASGDIILILDADATPGRNVVNRMASRLIVHADVVAVTGNPRVIALPNLLTKMQAIEFSSTISTLRRGQSAWGRINTVSGIMTLFRKNILQEIGGFYSNQPTEDIEITWRIQLKGYRCVYEPAAQVGMLVPENLKLWFRQRNRWSRGLVRVLQTHGVRVLKEKQWGMLPLLLEATLAIIWCHLLIAMTLLWVVGSAYGLFFIGNTVIIGQWGALTLSIAMIQIFWGMYLDSTHDKNIHKLWILAPIYPIVYWWLSAVSVVITTIPTLLTSKRTEKWESPRKVSTSTKS